MVDIHYSTRMTVMKVILRRPFMLKQIIVKTLRIIMTRETRPDTNEGNKAATQVACE